MTSYLPQLRVVNEAGDPGEILPDWRTLSLMDDSLDVGQIEFEYPEKGGIRAGLLKNQVEVCVVVNGRELDNARFRLQNYSGNLASDTPGYRSWSGKNLLQRFDEALVDGALDMFEEQDVFTRSEAELFRKERQRWVDDRLAAQRRRLGKTKSIDKRPKIRNTLTEFKQNWKPGSKLQERRDGAPPPKPPVFKNVTAGEYMLALVREAQKRGALSEIRCGFTKYHDSDGQPWQELLIRRPEVGATLLTELRSLAEDKKAEGRMFGRTLLLFNSESGDPESGRTSLIPGRSMTDGPVEGSSEELVTAVFVTSESGVHGWVADPSLVRRFGVIEGVFEMGQVQTWDAAEAAARKWLRDQGKVKQQNTYGLVVSEELRTRPYVDFRMKDWLWVDKGGRVEPERVRVITLSWDESRNLEAGVTTNDRLYEASVVANRTGRKRRGKPLRVSPYSRLLDRQSFDHGPKGVR